MLLPYTVSPVIINKIIMLLPYQYETGIPSLFTPSQILIQC